MLCQLVLSQTSGADFFLQSVRTVAVVCHSCAVGYEDLRFQTDAGRLAGVEKLAVSSIRAEFLSSPLEAPKVSEFCPTEDGFLAPNTVFFVKGWSRSVAAVTCLLHAYEMADAFQARVFVWPLHHIRSQYLVKWIDSWCRLGQMNCESFLD